tara:strand:+ start:4158 stop:4571 length:414 start_codon:yes stop_codon:yes gene_type:complete
MAGLTNYLEDKIMNHVFGSTTFTKPTNYYVGLLTATPSDSAAGTEVSGGSYARQVCAFTITGSGIAEAKNTSAITFPTATADWGIVGWVGVYDALSSGNLVAYQNLQKSDFSTTTTKTINDGDIFKFNAETIKLQLD